MNAPDPKTFYNKVMPEKIGGDYENARWHSTPLKEAQYRMTLETVHTQILPLFTNARKIVEVGPGTATWTKIMRMAHPDASYTLVDISSEMLARARTTLASYDNIEFIEADLSTFKPVHQFNGFFSVRAVEYMPDKQVVAHNIAAILSSGANGAIITKMPKPFFDRLRGRGQDDFHSGMASPRVLAQALNEAGLIVKKVRVTAVTVPAFNSAVLNESVFVLLKHIPLVWPLSIFAESYCMTFIKP